MVFHEPNFSATVYLRVAASALVLLLACDELPRTYSSAGPARLLFSDRFDAPELGPAWKTTGAGAKGVLTSWACLADFLPHGAEALDLDATSRWAEPTHPSYDLALTNWLLALGAGASLHVSGSLAERAGLRAELELVDADVFLVELKAAAVDVVVEEAHRRGVRVVIATNDVVPLAGDADLDAELDRLASEAVELVPEAVR